MAHAEALHSFIAATFRSVWALELLCLLRRNRDVSLTQADMISGLTASQLVVSQSLDSLSAAQDTICQVDRAVEDAAQQAANHIGRRLSPVVLHDPRHGQLIYVIRRTSRVPNACLNSRDCSGY